MTRRARSLRHDRRGATIIEFALIVPVLLSVILGLSELAYQSYIQSVLLGSMQRAGRDSTIQGNQSQNAGNQIDEMVMKRVKDVARGVTWQSTRKSYAQFGNIAAETFSDDNKNNVYDKDKECFIDVNDNHVRDLDPGVAGQGGASDVVVYRMDVTYSRLLPVARLLGMSSTAAVSATTILKNQPWSQQQSYAPTKVCP